MKRSEVSKYLGIHKNTILYYEKCGLIKPKRSANGYREYAKEDMIKLAFAKKMLDGGVPSSLIKKALTTYSAWKYNRSIDDCKKTFLGVESIALTIEEEIEEKKRLASTLRENINSFNCTCTERCNLLDADSDADCPLINLVERRDV